MSNIYAICEKCEEFYDVSKAEDEGLCPGYCDDACEESRDGSCYCNATNHPPCSWCEGSVDKEHDLIGSKNDIFLWSLYLGITKR